jgi:hypothetical protein
MYFISGSLMTETFESSIDESFGFFVRTNDTAEFLIEDIAVAKWEVPALLSAKNKHWYFISVQIKTKKKQISCRNISEADFV